MKNIQLTTLLVNLKETIKEEYSIEDNEDMMVYANNLINNFNKTLRPHESPRELLRVIEIETSKDNHIKHQWEKQNLVTIIHGGENYDKLKCVFCGITAKRYGMNQIKRDSKYKAAVYDNCDTARDQIEKNNKRRYLK